MHAKKPTRKPSPVPTAWKNELGLGALGSLQLIPPGREGRGICTGSVTLTAKAASIVERFGQGHDAVTFGEFQDGILVHVNLHAEIACHVVLLGINAHP